MAPAMGMRATSLTASAALLGLAALAGLTMTIVQPDFAPPEGRLFEIYVAPPPPSDPPRPREEEAPPLGVEEGPFIPIERPQHSTIAEVAADETRTPQTALTIVNPTWVRRPRDLARYYPVRALQREIEGRVVLDCAVSTAGALSCAVVSESPANWGFAEAALRISRDYRMVPATRGGAPVEARHRMVVPFELR